MGNHRGLVGFLAPLVAQHPLAEQLAGLYITALYRSNRQADALAERVATRGARPQLGTDTGCPECRPARNATPLAAVPLREPVSV